MKKILQFLFTLLCIAVGAFVITQIEGGILEYLGFLSTGTSVFAFSYVMASVPKSGTNPGRSKPKKDKLIIFNMNDVDSDLWPSRDANGIKITGDISLLPGKSAIHLYFTPGSIKIGNKSEGDPDAKGYIQTVEFDHPGSALQIEEFLENNVNSNIGVIIQYCDDTVVKLAGSPCNPLQMGVDSMDDNTADKSKITLTSVQRGSRIAIYEGTLPETDDESGS